jgi:uncharacterized phage protein gp47/JayE
MAFALRSQQDVLTGILNELRSSGINYLPRGSKARAIGAALAKEFDIAYRFFDSNFDQAYLNGASGELLEALGILFGVRRIPAKKAVTSSYEQNLVFYVDSGTTFGDINGGSDFTISAGEIIRTPSGLTGVDSLEYQVLSSVLCRSTSNIAFVTAEALAEGDAHNVGRHSLTEHTFTGYTDAASETLKVINRFGIVNGVPREADLRLKQRISIAATALQAGNLTSIRFALLSVPGIVDIRLLRYHDGIGTVGAFVSGQDNEAPPSLLAQGQIAIDSLVSQGEICTVYSPNRVGIDFTTHVNLVREITINERNQIERKLLDAINTHFTGMVIGEDLDIPQLLTAMQRADTLIVNFGISPGVSQFDQIGRYRYSDASGERVRNEVLPTIEEISIEDHEIFIPELSIANPFNFTFDPIT